MWDMLRMSLVGIAMHQECFSMATPVAAAADKHSCAAGRALIKLQCHGGTTSCACASFAMARIVVSAGVTIGY